MRMRYFLVKLKKQCPIIIALVIFFFYLSIYFNQESLVTHDATRDISYGIQLFQGGLESFKFNADTPPYSPLVYTPGYTLLIGLINKIIHDPIFSAYLVSMVAATLLSLTVFYLSRHLFNAPIGYISLLLCGFYPKMVYFAVSTYVRSTAMLFLVLSLYLFVLALRGKGLLYSILAGAAMGMAILTRFEFAIYGILFFIVITIYVIQKKITLNYLVFFVLTVSFIYSPYAIALYRYSGYKVISPVIGNISSPVKLPHKPHVNIKNYKKLNLGIRGVLFNSNTAISKNLKKQTKVKVSEDDWKRYPSKMDKRKGSIISKYKSLFERIIPWLFRPHLVGFFLLGIFYCIRKKLGSSLILYAFLIITLSIYPLGSTWARRYYAHLLPFMLIISSCGIYFIIAVLRDKLAYNFIGYLIVSLIIGMNVYKDVTKIKTSYSPQEQVWLECAEYLKENGDKASIVMARKKHAAFYSNLRMSWLPDEQNLNDVWEYSNYIGADYLIIDKKLTVTLMPQYKLLLEDKVPSFLKIEKELFKGTEYFTRIFRFKR